jgi:hypothetical protein
VNDQQARNSQGKFVRTPQTARRDAEAAELRAQGLSSREIAEQLGFADKGEAHHAVQRALLAIVKEPAEKLRTLELARLDAMYEAAMGVLERRHVTVSNGKIIYLGDEPLEDDAPVLAAIDRLLKVQERRARLLGLDAPKQLDVALEQRIDLDAQLVTDALTAALDAVDLTDEQRTAALEAAKGRLLEAG